MTKLRVAIVFGGRSGEHEVSLRSARAIFDALDRTKYEPVLVGIDRAGVWHLEDAARALLDPAGTPLRLEASERVTVGDAGLVPTGGGVARGVDVFFPIVHGTYGEDGTLQGLLEMAGAAYVGSGVLGSSAGMDKDVAKKLLAAAGLPVVPWRVCRAHGVTDFEAEARATEAAFGWPVFVKPANMGSSVGVSKARNASEFVKALADAFRYDTKVVVEKGLAVREVEVAVLGNEAPEASVAGEIAPTHEFYSYEAKYLDADGARLSIPAALDEATHARLRRLAVESFVALELSGLARVDFFVERGTEAVFVNEVNTLPGFTSISMYPKLWEASGLSFSALVDRLITLALARQRARAALLTEYRGG